MILVSWYGSFPAMGTIGDLLAVRSVVSRLVAAGLDVTHASAHGIEIPGSLRVELAEAAPNNFGALLFVCGPIIRDHAQTQALFAQFAALRKIGVGVSLFPPSHRNYDNPFDLVLAREGRSPRYEDVAIAAPLDPDVRARTNSQFTVGVVLRGTQSEYEPRQCFAERTAEIVDEAARTIAARRNGRVVNIENHLHRSGLPAASIEAQYAACDLVLTSRFHGAMLALRHDVPFVAIDQIEGGAKVRGLLASTGWPCVFEAEATDGAAIAVACEHALTSRMRQRLAQVKHDAIRRAHATLASMEEAIQPAVAASAATLPVRSPVQRRTADSNASALPFV